MLQRVLKSVLGIGMAVGMAVTPLLAQAPAAQKAPGAQKKVKDQGEYDLYNSVSGAASDPNKQLQLLQTWKEKYPDSDFKEDRAAMVAQDYHKLNKPVEAIKAAQEVLSVNPKNLTALVVIIQDAIRVNPPTPETLSAGEQAANTLISNLDSLKPAGLADAAWNDAKANIELLAQTTLGWVKMQQKDNDAAATAFTRVLTINGKNGQVAYWLGTVLYAQKKFAPALFEFARAAVYTGEGALPEATRTSADQFLTRAYKGYHGSDEGLAELKAKAATTALPPDDLKILSVTDIEKDKEAKEGDYLEKHPDIKLWRTLRDALKADGGDAYFNANVKDALLPPAEGPFKAFKGRVVSMPSPKEIIVAVDESDGPAGDATLMFETPVRGTVEPGTELTFAGAPQSYTKDPYNMKFVVEHKNVTGLPAAPAPVRRAPVRKKTK